MEKNGHSVVSLRGTEIYFNIFHELTDYSVKQWIPFFIWILQVSKKSNKTSFAFIFQSTDHWQALLTFSNILLPKLNLIFIFMNLPSTAWSNEILSSFDAFKWTKNRRIFTINHKHDYQMKYKIVSKFV